MAFLLRKYHGGHPYAYVVVGQGLQNHIDPNAVTYDPDIARATRFNNREEAERWRTRLSGGSGTIEVEEIG